MFSITFWLCDVSWGGRPGDTKGNAGGLEYENIEKLKIITNHNLNVSGIVFAEKVDQKQSSLESLVSIFRAKPLKQNELESTTIFQFYPMLVKVRPDSYLLCALEMWLIFGILRLLDDSVMFCCAT